jgi:phosphatidylglycerophosphate synthase
MEQSGKKSCQGRSLIDRVADGLLLLALVIVAAVFAPVVWLVLLITFFHGGE